MNIVEQPPVQSAPQLTLDQQVDAIIEDAVARAKSRGFSKTTCWRTYEHYKQLVNAINLDPWQYESAIRRLTDALGV